VHSSDTDPLGPSLVVSLAVHALVLLGIGFVLPPSPRPPPPVPTLDILLVSKPQPARPEKFDYLAEANQEGGGASEGAEPPQAPVVPPLRRQRARSDEAPAPSGVVRSPTVPKAHAPAARAQAPEREAAGQSPPETPEPVSASELITRSLDLARLSESVQESVAAYNRLPRERFISARTSQSAYAAYMEAWRAKVERIGNLNYPEQARRQGLTGDLVLDVALDPDGSVHSVTVLRSSGSHLLDEAAEHIVHLAAPFAPFPEDIRKDTDLLHITRTWRFEHGSRLASSP
jgi:protein TonB